MEVFGPDAIEHYGAARLAVHRGYRLRT